MGEMSLDALSEKYFDVLKELGNIGAGNATTALAQMIGDKVDMSVPQVRLLEFKDVGDIMGGADKIMTAIYLKLEGDVNGSIMFMLGQAEARHLVNKLTGQNTPDDEPFGEMDMSALQEIGNIITGSYLNSLSQMTQLVMLPSVPYAAVDMAGAILSVPAIEFGIMGDKMLLIETSFSDDKISLHLFMNF